MGIWLLNPNFTEFHSRLPFFVLIFVSLNSNFIVMNKFLLIEGKTYTCYVNPEHVAFVERKNRMTYIHLVSGEVVETLLPVEQVVSLLSQQ